MKCENFFAANTSIIKEIGKNSLGLCPLAFYSIFPYYLTLINSGIFEWVQMGEDVKVQCPKVDGIVMEAELVNHNNSSRKSIEVRIVEIKGFCYQGHTKGEVFNLSSKEENDQ